MVTVEALQTMMTNLQAQAHQKKVTLAQQHMDALKVIVNSNTRGNSSGMTDTRCIGRPVVFKGDEQRYGGWKAKLFAFLRVSTPQAMEWISWAGSLASTIDEDLIKEYFQGVNQGGDQLWESALVEWRSSRGVGVTITTCQEM